MCWLMENCAHCGDECDDDSGEGDSGDDGDDGGNDGGGGGGSSNDKYLKYFTGTPEERTEVCPALGRRARPEGGKCPAVLSTIFN